MFRIRSFTAPALAAAALLAAGNASAASGEITLATWGGFYAKTFQETLNEDFTKETGIRVKMIPGVSAANYQLVASQRDNPQIDVIMLVADRAFIGVRDGLLQPFSAEDIPNVEGVVEGAVHRTEDGRYGYAGMFGSIYGLGYRADLVPFEIDEWADLWRPELKNKVGVSSPRHMSAFFLLTMNKMAGGNEADVTPGLEKVRTLKENLIAVNDDGPAQVRMLAQGEVWATPLMSGAAAKAKDDGVPITWVLPKEGAGVVVNVIALVKNSPNPEGAKKYINHVLSASAIKKVSDALSSTPLRKDVEPSAEAAPFSITPGTVDRALYFDNAAIVADLGTWMQEWDRKIAPLVSR